MNPPMICPRCGTNLSTLTSPCPTCDLGFVRRELPCPQCGLPLGHHTLAHPRVRRGPSEAPQTCPLCGGPRHRKDAQLSRHQCLWRQWAVEAGRVPNPGDPKAPLPDDEDGTNLAAFAQWLDAPGGPDGRTNRYREAGSVPAERILRHRSIGLISPN